MGNDEKVIASVYYAGFEYIFRGTFMKTAFSFKKLKMP